MATHSLRHVATTLVAGVTFLVPAAAQCSNQWLPGPAILGADQPVAAITTWDPDGAGPLAPVFVVGGSFAGIGTAGPALATFDPVTDTWAGVGSGLSGPFQNTLQVRALAVAPNGDLIVGGNFLFAGGVPVANLARWNGTSWSAFGTGVGGSVNSIAVRPNGDVVIGGEFTLVDGIAANRVARWDGSQWHAMGSGPTLAGHPVPVRALTALPNGDVVVAGKFAAMGGVPANSVARWDGSQWHAMGSGMFGQMATLLTLPNGDVLCGGDYTLTSSVENVVARWDGATWSPLGTGLTNAVYALARLPNGDIVAAGDFVAAGGTPALRIARWNGSTWQPYGAGLGNASSGTVYAVAGHPSGGVLAGGSFLGSGSVQFGNVAHWSGSSWEPTSTQVNGNVFAIAVRADGRFAVGGSFTTFDGVLANRVVLWDGNGWVALGSGMNADVRALEWLPNGELVAAGTFTTAGGVPAARVARWNGATWSPLGAGLAATVFSLARAGNGDLLAGGAFAERVARFDGTSWIPLLPPHASPSTNPVASMVTLPNGDVAVLGAALLPGATVGRWDGTTWTALPAVQAQALALSYDGQLLASTSSIAVRFDGVAWQTAADFGFPMNRIVGLPGGDIVGGHGYVGAANLRRWNGTTATPLAGGVTGPVYAFALHPNGDLLVGGAFQRAGTVVSSRFARLTTTCPATATSAGAGCAGASGIASVAATSLPWLGATFRSEAVAMPAVGLALGVFGFGTMSLPLAPALPAGPSCALLVTPDALAVELPANQRAAFALTIPNSLALVGGTVQHQAIALDLDGSGAITSASSSNRLTLTFGVF